MPTIQEKFINRNCTFINQLYRPLWFVVHCTGGTPNLQSLYNYWQSSCVSSHYGIERYDNQWAKAGDIWQFVRLTDGSGANCCLGPGCAPFLPTGINLNVRCVTVECINANSDNSGLMPQPQYGSLVWLIREICKQMGISTTKYTEYSNYEGVQFTFGDGQGGVIMHRDVDYQNRKRCPGMEMYTNQMKQLMKDVNGGTPPQPQEEDLEYMATQLELLIPATLIFAGGNRKQWLRVATDHSDANVRLAFHIVGTSSFTIKSINVKPGQNCNDTLVGPGGLNSDYVSVEVTEFNKPDKPACAASIVPY